MIFNSVQFVVFFVVVFALYLRTAAPSSELDAAPASYVFYAGWDWRFLGLLIG